MIEPNWRSTWGKKNSDTVSDHQRSWVIDFESLAAVQLNRKHLIRLPRYQRIQHAVKILGCHS